jgi:hypothetical protein
MTDPTKALERVAETLRSVNSLRDFVAAVEVGTKVAHDILNEAEQKLLDVMDAIGDLPNE